MNRLTNIAWGFLHIFHIHYWNKWGESTPREMSNIIFGDVIKYCQYRNCQYCNQEQMRFI